MTNKKMLTIIIALTTTTLLGCASKDYGAVVIEYEHPTNFHAYTFDDFIVVGNYEQKSIRGVTSDGRNGVWMLYQVCAIHNENQSTKAKNVDHCKDHDEPSFPYNVHNFYVDYNGKKFHYQDLEAYKYKFGSTLNATPPINNVVKTVFRQETQTGEDTQCIEENAGSFLSVSWRFPIFVEGEPGDSVNDLLNLDLPLRYDGPPHILDDRGRPLVAARSTKRTRLPYYCEPTPE